MRPVCRWGTPARIFHQDVSWRVDQPEYLRPLLAWALAQQGDVDETRKELAHCEAPGRPVPREEGAQWALRAGAHNALGEPETAA
jgi:hypothetical protein